MDIHKEIKLEDEICEHLSAHGWLYNATHTLDYDQSLALFPSDTIAWVQETQPDACESRTKNRIEAERIELLQ